MIEEQEVPPLVERTWREMKSEEALTKSEGLRKRRWEDNWEGAWAQLSGYEYASPITRMGQVCGRADTVVGPESAEVGLGLGEGNLGEGAPRKQLGPGA